MRYNGQPFATPADALKHFGIKGMRWGVRKIPEPSGYETWGRPYKSSDGLGHGSKKFELKNPEQLRVDRSDGFTNVVSANGFTTDKGRQIHAEMVDGLKQARETYPAVANLKIVIAPFSSLPGSPGKSVQAAVLHTKPGEVFIGYNDKMKDHSPGKVESWAKWIPGTKYPGYIGQHEMGHVVAVANKLTPPYWDAIHERNPAKSLARVFLDTEQNEANHKAAFVKHGLTFEEVAKLSPYAATSAAEAYAELAGNYHTPQLRSQMSPDLSRKAKSLFEDSGGKR